MFPSVSQIYDFSAQGKVMQGAAISINSDTMVIYNQSE